MFTSTSQKENLGSDKVDFLAKNGNVAHFDANSSEVLREIEANVMKSTELVNNKCESQDSLTLFSCPNFSQMVLSPPEEFNDDVVKELDFLEAMCESEITFEKPQQCIIINSSIMKNQTVLSLQTTKTNQLADCTIEGFWRNNKFDAGDNVYILAQRKCNKWVVDNEVGWIVYEPDLLISCTTVVGSVFCKRKSILAERYRGFDPSNRAMIVGTLIHTLLQTVLKNKLRSLNEIEEVAKNLVQTSNIIRNLYDCDLTVDDILNEIQKFTPRIVEFINEYIVFNSKKRKKDTWHGKICAIDDIEDNIWCPELGIKGKIDVTVQTESNIMPLELKTGRATASIEHRGQVILYIMMMNRLGYKISSGLLLYLRENILKEIPTTVQEERDLIILRNELAYFLNKKAIYVQNENKTELIPPELPPPIDHFNACIKCPYNIICMTHLKKENYNITSNLEKLLQECTLHLTEKHINYFIKWSALIKLEESVQNGRKNLQEIYTKPASQRQKEGRCISNVKLVNVGKECNGIFEQIFEKNENDITMLASGITENNYVIVSIDSRPAIATGFVTHITARQISIGLERDLSVKYKNNLFHLDTYDSYTSQAYNLTSLSLILEQTSRAAELRDIIIEKKPPTFLSKLPGMIAKKGASILKSLNRVQQRAVLRALTANEYLLIKGMPGTGKTATLVALIQLLVTLDKSVLLTSHTHAAVDNVCIRLKKLNVDFIRLGSNSRIDQNLINHSEYNQTKTCNSPEELQQRFNGFKVVAVTCLGSGHPLLSKRNFDVCIVDESTQVVQISVIRALYSSRTFILVGDPNQLPPVIRNKDAINEGMQETLFDRLQYPEAIVTLNLNYRMNKTITDLANAVTYGGDLEIALPIVAENTLKIPNLEDLKLKYKDENWILQVLDATLDGAVKVIDTGPVWKKIDSFTETFDSQTQSNSHEAAIVFKIVKALIEGGISGCNIGVIATFRAQVALISTLLLKDCDISVSTVDQFQGKDKDIIIYSCTKSKDIVDDAELKTEILNDKRRLTVAITRAKQKFILIGDLSTVIKYSTFNILLKSVDKSNFIEVKASDV